MYYKINYSGYYKNGDAMNLITALIRTIFFYFFIMISYRIMGKREIAELGVIDLIVSILIANIVAISIENLDHNILESVIPIIILVLLEVGFAYLSVKNNHVRMILSGKPALIINKGKINHQEMIKQRYTLDDLLLELRNKEIKNIKEVAYAILEPNGSLSVFKAKSSKNIFPLPLIMDGSIINDSLKYLNKEVTWLEKIISSKNLNLSNIFYAYYKNNTVHFILKKDL